MTFEKIEYKGMADIVIDQVADRILSGELKVDDRIPPELELMKILGVGRSTVREALKSLETLGIIRRNKEGTFVNLPASTTLSKVFHCFIALKQITLEELLEVRLVLETRIAELVAQKVAMDKDMLAEIEKLEELLDRIKDAEGDMDKIAESYVDFHIELAKCTKNSAFYEMIQMLRPALIQSQYITLKKEAVRKGGADEGHRSILEAIKGGDSEKAKKLMQKHIELVYNSI